MNYVVEVIQKWRLTCIFEISEFEQIIKLFGYYLYFT